MSGKYDALIAEAAQAARNLRELFPNCKREADTYDRLAAALRELQAHVPPPGWRVTEYAKGEDKFVWRPTSELDGNWCIFSDLSGKEYPTAAAAMAAIEEMGK